MILILLNFIVLSCAQIQTRFHPVTPGETLARIAARYSISEIELRGANTGILQDGLQPGEKLYVPFESSPEWDRALADDMVRRADFDVADVPNSFPGFVWPVAGYVSSGFGMRRGSMHDGVDIVAAEGAGVRAARSGHVIYAHNRIGGYGNMVIIRHPDSYSTVYAHLSRMEVRKGQFISKGQSVGRVGQTGHAEGPHLHFEVRNNRQPVNPLLYLQVRVANNILRR